MLLFPHTHSRLATTLVLLAVSCLACTDESPPPKKAPAPVAAKTQSSSRHDGAAATTKARTWQIDGAIVLKETITDSPIKTQIELRVSVPRGTSKSDLDAYLRGVYEQQMAREGFKARKSPNAVYVFVYPEGAPSSGLGWIGRVAKAASDETPEFTNLNVSHGVTGAREALSTTTTPGPMEPRVEETADGLRVLLHHTKKYSTEVYAADSDRVFAWQTMFYAAELLYGKVPEVDRVRILVQHRDIILIDAHLTAKTFAALGFGEVMKDVMIQVSEIAEQRYNDKLSSEEAATKERQADIASFKVLFERLPPGAINFHPSVKL